MDLPDLISLNRNNVWPECKNSGPDVIINAAAFTRVDDCETNERKPFAVNGDGAGNLARAAASTGSHCWFIIAPTMFSTAAKRTRIWKRTMPNPQSVYGKSKLLGENLVRSIVRTI